MKADLLANVERAEADKPKPSKDTRSGEPHAGYWHGGGHAWRARALAAEALLEDIRVQLRAWRPTT